MYVAYGPARRRSVPGTPGRSARGRHGSAAARPGSENGAGHRRAQTGAAHEPTRAREHERGDPGQADEQPLGGCVPIAGSREAEAQRAEDRADGVRGIDSADRRPGPSRPGHGGQGQREARAPEKGGREDRPEAADQIELEDGPRTRRSAGLTGQNGSDTASCRRPRRCRHQAAGTAEQRPGRRGARATPSPRRCRGRSRPGRRPG